MNGPHGEQMTPVDPSVQKVLLEIKDLKWKVNRIHRIAPLLSFIPTLVAIGALALSLYQFNNNQEQEIKKPIKEKQLTLLFELSDVVARIATLKPDDAERKKAEARFQELYWGSSLYIQDPDLREWMVKFGNCLNEFIPGQDLNSEFGADANPDRCTTAVQQEVRLKNLSLNFAIDQRKKLGIQWEVPFKESSQDTIKAQNKATPLALP